MKKIKLFLRNLVEKIFPNMSNDKWTFVTRVYVFYAKLVNLLRYGDYNFFTGISIETSTYCNRKCVYCPNYYHQTPKLYAEESMVYKALDDLASLKYSGWISFTFYNEPSLDTRLTDFIKYANKKMPQAAIMMFSNGDFLDIDKVRKYKDVGVNQFIITIHDKNPEKSLERLSEIKKTIGNSFRIQTLKRENLITRAGEIELEDPKPFKYCDYIRNPVIDKDGNMLMCCNDYFRVSKMGNILEESILDIWNKEKYKAIRKALRRDILKYRSDIVPSLCYKCFSSMNKANDTK